mgnify:CR=1 FL=1
MGKTPAKVAVGAVHARRQAVVQRHPVASFARLHVRDQRCQVELDELGRVEVVPALLKLGMLAVEPQVGRVRCLYAKWILARPVIRVKALDEYGCWYVPVVQRREVVVVDIVPDCVMFLLMRSSSDICGVDGWYL